MTVFGFLIAISNLLEKIPIILWLVILAATVVYMIVKKTDASMYTFIVCAYLFLFMLIGRYDIASMFIGALGFSVLIPIIVWIAAPYIIILITLWLASKFKQ